MSIEEYHARQRAIEAQNQLASRSTSALALRIKLDEIRRHIEAALLHIDQVTDPDAWRELNEALDTLAKVQP